MKPVVALIGVGIVVILLGSVMLALDAFRGTEIEAPYNVTTAIGETSETITLANEVLDDATSKVVVVSNLEADAPIPYSYTSSTRQLLVNGLVANTTRALTVTYQSPRLDDYTDLTARFLPMFMILGGIAVVVGSVIQAFRHRD